MTQVQRLEPEKDNGGEWVRIGSIEVLAPPLNFRALRELLPIIKSLPSVLSNGGQLPAEEHVRSVSKVIHTALRRNYPSKLSIEQIEEELELQSCMEVISKILNVSGFRKAASPGE